MLYVDTSALLKRYVLEHDSAIAIALMEADPVLITSRLTEVEVRRNLVNLLSPDDAQNAKGRFLQDLDAFALVSLDDVTCNSAASIAEQTRCRSLDALHLATALRAGSSTTVLTFDIRQAQAARSIGLAVAGT